VHSTFILESTAYTLEQLSRRHAPQLALAGRSNVGKSSLVNALANRKKLARVSAAPGKTRSINYYRAEPDGFHLVDLPGYGYARCSMEEREKWRVLIERYLVSTPALKALVLLLDCRLPPQKADLALLAFARHNAIPLLPVLTKADKCSRNEQTARQREWSALLPSPPILTSASKGQGLAELWRALREAGQETSGRALEE
jgi:GTP-binding protein